MKRRGFTALAAVCAAATLALAACGGGGSTTTGGGGGYGPYFGSIPDFGQVEHGGVKFADVRDGSPAGKAGLKAGEKIASSGVFKLRPGMSVTENNDITPKSSTTPRPADS